MLTYDYIKTEIEKLTPAPRSKNIFSLMMNKGYKFYIQELPKTLSDYSKGYLAEKNFKGFKYSISLKKERLDSLRDNLIIITKLIEYEEERISYKIQLALTMEEKAFFLFDEEKSDLLTFIKYFALKEEIKNYLEAYLVELDHFKEAKSLGHFQKVYFTSYEKKLRDATEENINAFLMLWNTGLISKGAREIWSDQERKITDFRAFLEESINKETAEATRKAESIANNDKLIALRVNELTEHEQEIFLDMVKKINHAPGVSYFNECFKEACLSEEEKELLRRALQEDLKEDSPLLEKLIGAYLLNKDNKSHLEALSVILSDFRELMTLYDENKLGYLTELFLSVFNSTDEEETELAIINDDEARLKNADYLTSIRGTFPRFTPATNSPKDLERQENYFKMTRALTSEIAQLEEELKEVENRLRELNRYSLEDKDLRGFLTEREAELKKLIAEKKTELKPLTRNIAIINNTFFINRNFLDTYKSDRLGFYEIINPGSNTILYFNEEALIYSDEITQALFLWICIAITEAPKNPLFFKNEDILDFYRAQKGTIKEDINQEKELERAKELIYKHLNYLKGMQIKELKSKLKDAEKYISNFKSTKKDISLIGTIISGTKGGIIIYIDAYFFDAIRQHQGTLRLSPTYKKLPPRARLLYVALEELTYINSKERGARFNYSYEAIIKRNPAYLDKGKYTGKDTRGRVLAPINEDAEKIEALGLIQIDHLLENTKDTLTGIMLYNRDFYEQREKDHKEAKRKAYIHQERKTERERLEHKNKK